MKNSIGYLVVVAFVTTLSFMACEKEYKTRVCDDTKSVECVTAPFDSTRVYVRIINNTGYPLCNFQATFETPNWRNSEIWPSTFG